MSKETLLKISGVPVYWIDDTYIEFTGEMTSCADGSPRAYGPSGCSPAPLDYEGNAGYPGNWWGVVTVDGDPFTQKKGKPVANPYPSLYVSCTAYFFPEYAEIDCRRWVDAELVKFSVIPSSVRMAVPPKFMGCRATILDKKTDKLLECVCAEIGPEHPHGRSLDGCLRGLWLEPGPEEGRQLGQETLPLPLLSGRSRRGMGLAVGMEKLRATALAQAQGTHVTIRKARPKREWIDRTGGGAYRCLPLVMACQLGWELILPETVSAYWDGGPNKSNLHVLSGEQWASSHFNHGILTFHVWTLFRTPKDVNLFVTGPANFPMAHISPLEGIVETDWAPMSFTMNWQFTSIDTVVTFPAGEPFARIFPVPRGFVEGFELEEIYYQDMPPDERTAYEDWRGRRAQWFKENQPAEKPWDQVSTDSQDAKLWMLGMGGFKRSVWTRWQSP